MKHKVKWTSVLPTEGVYRGVEIGVDGSLDRWWGGYLPGNVAVVDAVYDLPTRDAAIETTCKLVDKKLDG